MDKDKVHFGLLQPGTIIGDSYRVEAFLGKGGMGEVWVARHLRLANRRVAVKVLRTQGESLSAEALSRFRKEAEIASRLQHPHIVNIHDYNFTPAGQPFMVMEFLEGESLGARLRREGPFPLAETRAVIRQICRALEATHSQGILHRDLKPDNIFLTTQSGELWVKVLDFGISKILDSNTQFTQESIVIGSPRYISPEQARGQNSRLTPQADIFSLGAVAYEMLTGKSAFEGDEVSQVLFRVVYESPAPLSELLPELPSGARHAIETAMEKQPDKRHASAMAFSEAFDKDTFVPTHPYGLPPEAPGIPSPPEHVDSTRTLPPPSKRPWLLTLTVGGLAASIIGGAVAYRLDLLTLGPEKDVVTIARETPDAKKEAADSKGTKPREEAADSKGTKPREEAADSKGTKPREEDADSKGTKPREEEADSKGTKPREEDADSKGMKPREEEAKESKGIRRGSKPPPQPPGIRTPPAVPQPKPPELPSLNAEEQRLLARAEKALKARQYMDAEVFARSSLTSLERNGAGWTRAYAIIAEVACAQRDSKKYNAALTSVPAAWRPAIRSTCPSPP